MTHFAKTHLHTGLFANYTPEEYLPEEPVSKEQEETEDTLDLSFVEDYYDPTEADLDELEEALRWQELEEALKASGETC